MQFSALLSFFTAAAAVSAAPLTARQGNVRPFTLRTTFPPAGSNTSTPLQLTSGDSICPTGRVGYFPGSPTFTGLTEHAELAGDIHNQATGAGEQMMYLRTIFGNVNAGVSILAMAADRDEIETLGQGFSDEWTIPASDGVLGYGGVEGRWSRCEDVTGSGNWTIYWHPGNSTLEGESGECAEFFDIEVVYD